MPTRPVLHATETAAAPEVDATTPAGDPLVPATTAQAMRASNAMVDPIDSQTLAFRRRDVSRV